MLLRRSERGNFDSAKRRSDCNLRILISVSYITTSRRRRSLRAHFIQSGQYEHLDNASLLHREALELQPVPHPDRSISVNNLAMALRTRFRQSGQYADLDDAFLCNREALDLRPDQVMSLDNVALALRTRFKQSGQRDDLDEAILFH
jgi:hypothetical protein